MPSINNLQISPVQKSINPEIEINFGLKTQWDRELTTGFSGCLVDSNDIRIASLSSWEMESNRPETIVVGGNSSRESNIPMSLYFQLSQKALEHIEIIRNQNENRDVKLRLKLDVRTINSRFLGPDIYIDNKNNGMNYLYAKDNRNKASGDIKLVAAQSGKEILEAECRKLGKEIIITSSDWAQNYCPALGVGRFATVDLFMPELEKAETELDKYLNDAIRTVKKMEQYVQLGEWTNVIEESRKLAEVLRERNNKLFDQWKELLGKSGYKEDALDEFYEMLNNLFHFSSKFVHRIDFDQNLRDQIKVEKEDAYFIYTTSIGLVNLLSRKVQEFKKSQ